MHSLSARSSALLALSLSVGGLVAHGQTAAGPAPAAPTSHDDPVALENFVVSATPFARNQAAVTSATSVLTGRALTLKLQPTLGETLADEVGVSSTYFGPGASRPIIRGLGGDRIRILANGTGSIDAATTSPDHAVAVEPFLVKRIEVVRGPASLLYGSSAVGGVVNVIDHRIETEIPAHVLSGQAEARYGDGADDKAFGGVADFALKHTDTSATILHLDGFRRRAGDIDIPGGKLLNTGIASDGGSAGLSFVGDGLSGGVNYNGFDTLYGVPSEPDVKIDLRQRRLDFAGELKREFGVFTGARFKLGTADYQHRELEGDEVGTTFTNKGYDGRLELLHAPLGGFTGAWGAQATRSDFAAIGEEAFLPPSLTEGRALFVFEEATAGALTWQLGARYEHQRISVDDGSGVRRTDDGLSASAGVVWTLAEPWTLAFSVTHTERAPNAQELFSDGPHVGTNAYEIGDPTLDAEKSLGAEISLRRRAGFVTGALNLYANRFSGYIFEQATGAVDPVDGLAIYEFMQRDAKFYGAEVETLWHLHESARHTLDLRVTADVTRATEEGGRDLPRIPPLKGSLGLAWQGGAWNAGADWHLVARQTHTAADETETAGYGLVSLSAGYRLEAAGVTYDVFVRGTNLADQLARMHTSFLKDIAPLPGRSFTVGIRASF